MEQTANSRVTLVLMPGMDGTGDLFEPLVDVLQARWRCRVLSYPTDVVATYDELLTRVLEQLPNEPYVLIAESFSGPLAVMIASRRPPLLRGLVLCASFLRSPLGSWTAPLSPIARLATYLRPPRFAISLALVGFGSPPALVRAVRAAIDRVNGAVLSHRLKQLTSVDVTAQAAQVDVPVLYLRATADRLVGPKCLALAEQWFPNLVEVPLNGPHLLLQRHPVAAAKAIEAYCARLQ